MDREEIGIACLVVEVVFVWPIDVNAEFIVVYTEAGLKEVVFSDACVTCKVFIGFARHFAY
jgi:hypothetical protein